VVVCPAAEQPGIAQTRQRRIGAKYNQRPCGLQHIGRDRVRLGRGSRAEERHNLAVVGKPAECQHRTRVGGLVILGQEFELPILEGVSTRSLAHSTGGENPGTADDLDATRVWSGGRVTLLSSWIGACSLA
jgi:hypothetical protein